MLQADGAAFLTPDDEGSFSYVTKRLKLPSFLWRYFNGAYGELLDADNWYQFGDMPIGDVVDAFQNAFDEMRPCEMIGQVVVFTNENLPDHILLCDGSTFDPGEFPQLYDHLGTDTLPDLRNRFLLGHGPGREPGDVGGSETHTLTVDEMPAHTHDYVTAELSATTIVVPDEPSAVPGPSITAPTGGNQPHNNMPPFYVVVYGIVAK